MQICSFDRAKTDRRVFKTPSAGLHRELVRSTDIGLSNPTVEAPNEPRLRRPELEWIRTAAFLLAGLTLLINVFMRDFWNDYPGGNPQHELQNFIKNLGIFAGLLLLAGRRQEQQRRTGAL